MTSEEFTEARKKFGTQQQFATYTGYTVRTIRRWEKGDWPVPKVIEIVLA